MRLVSFNVNSIRIRLHQLEAVIAKHAPAFIGIQETKVQDHDFPIEAINQLGYYVEFTGQKTHYGVALLSKVKPHWSRKHFATDSDDCQKRIIFAKYLLDDEEYLIVNGYFPQGESRSAEVKFRAKQKFYDDLLKSLQSEFSDQDKVVVMGDMNVAPFDVDIGLSEENKNRWLKSGKTSFLPEEIEWLKAIHNLGYVDSYRKLYPDKSDQFSWYDYRSRGFESDPQRGLRIDQILLTEQLSSKLVAGGIDCDIRAMAKPSDHCPVWAELARQ